MSNFLIRDLGSDGVEPSHPDIDKIMTQKEFAELCGIPPSTLNDSIEFLIEVIKNAN